MHVRLLKPETLPKKRRGRWGKRVCECVHVSERKRARGGGTQKEREREKAGETVLSNEHCAPRTITLSVL